MAEIWNQGSCIKLVRAILKRVAQDAFSSRNGKSYHEHDVQVFLDSKLFELYCTIAEVSPDKARREITDDKAFLAYKLEQAGNKPKEVEKRGSKKRNVRDK